MLIEIICSAVVIIILFFIIYENNKSNGKVINMSFKEAMDLTELPVITFYNNGKKLNFLLDTGSNLSQINKSVLPLLDYKSLDEKSMQTIGIEGNKVENTFCEITFVYKNKQFNDEFCIQDLDAAFTIVKEESGVQIHGILGSLFFQKYKYVLDFSNLTAYSKSKYNK